MKGDQTPSLNIAKNINKGVFVEIGSWEGDFSYELLKQTECEILYCVDPYKHFTHNEYPDGMNNLTQEEFDNKFNAINNRFKEFGKRVEFIRLESEEASRLFADNVIDYIYIDGNHDYKYVKNDIEAWWPKLKSGGWMCGDDVYSHDLSEHDKNGNVLRVWSRDLANKPSCWGYYGTYKAVKDLESNYNFEPIFEQTQFLIKK